MRHRMVGGAEAGDGALTFKSARFTTCGLRSIPLLPLILTLALDIHQPSNFEADAARIREREQTAKHTETETEDDDG